jgi:hypothetical protein
LIVTMLGFVPGGILYLTALEEAGTLTHGDDYALTVLTPLTRRRCFFRQMKLLSGKIIALYAVIPFALISLAGQYEQTLKVGAPPIGATGRLPIPVDGLGLTLLSLYLIVNKDKHEAKVIRYCFAMRLLPALLLRGLIWTLGTRRRVAVVLGASLSMVFWPWARLLLGIDNGLRVLIESGAPGRLLFFVVSPLSALPYLHAHDASGPVPAALAAVLAMFDIFLAVRIVIDVARNQRDLDETIISLWLEHRDELEAETAHEAQQEIAAMPPFVINHDEEPCYRTRRRWTSCVPEPCREPLPYDPNWDRCANRTALRPLGRPEISANESHRFERIFGFMPCTVFHRSRRDGEYDQNQCRLFCPVVADDACLDFCRSFCRHADLRAQSPLGQVKLVELAGHEPSPATPLAAARAIRRSADRRWS